MVDTLLKSTTRHIRLFTARVENGDLVPDAGQLTLDIDPPRWQPALDRMEAANRDIARARARGGVGGWVRRQMAAGRAAMAFVSLLTIPSIPNEVPDNPRLQPAY